MLRGTTLSILTIAGWLQGVVSQQVDPIVIKGSKFFYSGNGTQFFIRGVAYQQDFTPARGENTTGYTDPLADASACARDLPYLTQLRTNTVRVYALDPTKDHTECMTMFANAGIYVLADLASPQESINQNDPAWTVDLYNRYTSVIDAMANYTNLLGFFAGNEVAFAPNSTDAAPFVKAAVRDMKSYIKSKQYRSIGVGYATNDNQAIRVPLANYMNCGDNQADAIDFWGWNVYSWCGDSSFEASGYAARTEEFQNYSVPVLLAEYGCNDPQPRMFQDTPVLYGPEMEDVWSGGIVYLYFQDSKDYGLVSVNGNSVSTLQDFDNLSSQIATVSPTGPNSASFSPTNSPQACPTQNANFSAAASPLPPSPNMNLCDCMFSSLECTISQNVPADDYGALFGIVCGLQDGICDGIEANGTTGTYGNFGMCESNQQLGYVLNQYYQAQNQNPSACDFSGSAVTQAAAKPTGSCEAALSSVGFSTSGGGGGGVASGGSSSTHTKKGSAGSIHSVAGVDVGYLTLGVMAWAAVISGVGMVVL